MSETAITAFKHTAKNAASGYGRDKLKWGQLLLDYEAQGLSDERSGRAQCCARVPRQHKTVARERV